MKNKKYKYIIGAIIVASIAIISAPREDGEKGGKPVIKIGAVFPMTGNYANLGATEAKAARAAIRDANQKCEAEGNCKYRYELLIEDFGGDNKMANNAAMKLGATDKVDALISYTTNAGKVVAGIADKYDIAHFNVSQGQTLSSPNSITTNLGDIYPQAARILIRKGAKKVSLLMGNIGSVEKNTNELIPLLDKAKIEYTIDRFNTDEKSFAILAEKVRSRGDDAIFISAFDPAQTILVQELRRHGVVGKTPIYFSDSLRFSRDFSVFEGMYNVGSVIPTEKFRAHIGLKPGDNPAFSSNIYDAVGMLVKAFEQTEGTSGAAVAKTLGGFGRYKGFEYEYEISTDRVVENESVLSTVKNGYLVPISEE